MQDTNIESIGELIVVEHKTLPVLFSEGKASAIVDDIEQKVRSFIPDIDTPKGRKDISSLAYKIAKSKKIMDDAGKTLTADWKAKAKVIDQERSKIWSRLEALQEEIRRPLTEYDEKEKQRIDNHRSALDFFKTLLQTGINYPLIDQMEKWISGIKEHFESRNWEEYRDQAKELFEKCELILISNISTRKLEIETKKREEAERKLKEDQDRIEREELKRVKAEYDKLICKKQQEESRSSQNPIPLPPEEFKPQEEAKIDWHVPDGIVGTCKLTWDKPIRVYIVLSHSDQDHEGWEHPEIMGVFSSRELAQANINYEGYFDPYIEEHEVIE